MIVAPRVFNVPGGPLPVAVPLVAVVHRAWIGEITPPAAAAPESGGGPER